MHQALSKAVPPERVRNLAVVNMQRWLDPVHLSIFVAPLTIKSACGGQGQITAALIWVKL